MKASLRPGLWTGLVLWLPPAWSAQPQEETKTAVVEVTYLFKRYEKVLDFQMALDKEFEPQKARLRQESEVLQREAEKLQAMQKENQSPDLLLDMSYKVQKMELEWKKELARMQAKQAEALNAKMKEALTEIRAAIRAEAEARHIRLVLRAPDETENLMLDDPQAHLDARKPGETAEAHAARLNAPRPGESETDFVVRRMMRPRNATELALRFHREPLLFGAEMVDITEVVLSALNRKYKQAAVPGTSPKR